MKKNKILLATVTLLGVFTLAACSSSKDLVSMKGGSITQEDYYNEIKKSTTSEQTLQNLVIYKVAENGYGDKVTDKEVTAQYNATKKSMGSSFDAALKQYGYTKSSLKKQIRQTLAFQEMVKAHIKVSDADLKSAWASYHPEVSAQIITASSKEDADAILKDIKAGGDFTKIAKEKSTDTSTKSDGGKVTFDSTSTSVPTDVQTAAYKLKDGEVSDVVTVSTTDSSTYTTTTSYYIVKMTKNKDKGNSMTPYKKTLKKIVTDTKASDSTFQQEVITKELKKADVEIKDDDLKSVLSSFLSTSSSSSSKTKSSTSSSKKSSTTTTSSSADSSSETSSTSK